MTTPATPHTVESADKLVKMLADACKRQGLATHIIEPSTKIKVFAPDGNPHLDEVVTLRPAEDEVLTWFWSWDSPICPAEQIGLAARHIERVVRTRGA
jgi:hypothetical protein